MTTKPAATELADARANTDALLLAMGVRAKDDSERVRLIGVLTEALEARKPEPVGKPTVSPETEENAGSREDMIGGLYSLFGTLIILGDA